MEAEAEEPARLRQRSKMHDRDAKVEVREGSWPAPSPTATTREERSVTDWQDGSDGAGGVTNPKPKGWRNWFGRSESDAGEEMPKRKGSWSKNET